MFNVLKLAAIIVCSMLLACTTTNNKPLLIEFSPDSSQILIKNISAPGLFQLKSKLETDTMYQKLVTVLQTPADEDSISMEKDWPGKLEVVNNNLIFKPDTPFVKGKNYLVETKIDAQFATANEVVRADVGHQLKAKQQLLVR